MEILIVHNTLYVMFFYCMNCIWPFVHESPLTLLEARCLRSKVLCWVSADSVVWELAEGPWMKGVFFFFSDDSGMTRTS